MDTQALQFFGVGYPRKNHSTYYKDAPELVIIPVKQMCIIDLGLFSLQVIYTSFSSLLIFFPFVFILDQIL